MADDPAQQDPGSNAPQPDAPATGEDALRDAGKAALEAERTARKEAERSAKALQRELEQLRTATLSDTEKAIAEAEKRGETNALTRVGSRLVDAELRVATQGRSLTPDALLAFDRSKFLNDDGDVDREALGKWVEQFSVPAVPESRRFGDADLGVRKTTPPADKDERAVARSLFGTATT